MSQLSPILRGLPNNQLAFWCPGCQMAHVVAVGEGAQWTYNQNPEKPTISPSIKVTHPWWVAETEQYEARVCHSFVVDGKIQFLLDSWHPLAGRVVALPEFL